MLGCYYQSMFNNNLLRKELKKIGFFSLNDHIIFLSKNCDQKF